MKMLAAALICLAVAASLAPPRRAQEAAGAEPRLNVPPTRFTYVDSQFLAGNGVRLEKDGKALADLRAFGEGLKVDIIDVEKLQGVVFIGDDRVDLTDTFLAAWKARPSRSAPLGVPAVTVPPARIAFINTDAFADPEKGIKRLAGAFRAIEAEFKPRRDEILKLKEKADAGSGDRKKLEGEIKRRQAAGQAELNKRLKELTEPIYGDIAEALKTFCQQHGLSLLFDAGKIKKTDLLPPFDVPFPPDMPDVTAAFVSAYNRGAPRHGLERP